MTKKKLLEKIEDLEVKLNRVNKILSDNNIEEGDDNVLHSNGRIHIELTNMLDLLADNMGKKFKKEKYVRESWIGDSVETKITLVKKGK